MAFGKFLWIPLFTSMVVPAIAQVYLDPSAPIEDRVQDLLSRMTLEEKVGQMTQANLTNLRSIEDVKTYFLGSILSGGGAAPQDNSPRGWADTYDRLQAKALETRLRIPILYGIDAVHGHNNVRGAVIFPHNIGMGCTWNPELVRRAARITAREVAGTGIDWTFAPCIAVPRDERWGRTYEGFGETPEITQMMAEAAVRGFQGDSLNDPTSIIACAKHYVGDGGTTHGIDQGNTEVDEPTLRAIHLPGYVAAVRAGVRTVMASYSSWNGVKMHAHKYLLTDVLKGELGFTGFVVSDWNGIDQLGQDYAANVKTAINAGIDMAMVPDKYVLFFNTLKQLVVNGDVPMSRIDDAVARILRVKFELGLFERPFTDRSLTDSIGCATHRAVARECVRQSLVLLKKRNGVLPLRRDRGRILVAGPAADNLGYQCGGWTISWQGGSGRITEGTTILQALQAGARGAEIVYSADGRGVDTADVAVIAIGETPYAEGAGDREDLHLPSEQVELVRRIKEKGIPTVVLLISGRPLILENVLHWCDVLFAAWLPGTEGAGIADVLYGDFPPTGRLTHSWPRSMRQIPINWGDASYDPLFPYRHGITTLEDYGVNDPPIFHSGLLRKDGRTVELAFSKPMATPTSPQGWQVRVNGSAVEVVSARRKEGDPFVLELTLAAAANAGDSLSVAYSPGQVRAVDGSALEAFGPVELYNLRNEGSGPQEIPGRVEAENYTAFQGVSLVRTTDVGGGSALAFDRTEWAEYDLVVPSTGMYEVTLRVSAASQQGRVGLVVGGQVLAVLDIPVTGGWENWTTVTASVLLNQGQVRLKVFAFMGGFRLNWLEFAWKSGVDWLAGSYPSDFRLYPPMPNPLSRRTVVSFWVPRESQVTVAVHDVLGREVQRLVDGRVSQGLRSAIWEAAEVPSGVYLVSLEAPGSRKLQRLVVIR
ncbi:MAG: glycoside hydrolase family 3 C-terminal domain-containing protein [candidate division KSB1 bacterium]|nr:glycoside hydrolase family 3 C-terminal domain-containing protein [candidate division KSB1 bacterium]